MPSPSSSLATLRPELGTFMEFDLAASRMGFIGLQVLRGLDVVKQAGPFGKITIESLLQARETVRAPGSGYQRGKYQFTTDSYACVEHGAEEPVDDREAQMYAEYFDAEMLAATRARDIVLRNYEQRVATAIFNTSTWTPTTITNEWDDASNATPITDVESAVQRCYAAGVKANALIVTWTVFRNLRNVDQIVNRITAAGSGDQAMQSQITPQKLAEVFDLDYVLVGDAQRNTADEGQTASLSPIWSNEYAAVCRVATTDDIREPCVGRTFHYTEDGSEIGAAVESYRDETVRGDVIRARFDTHEKVIYTEALELLDNITT